MNPLEIPDDLIYGEILPRLPTKSIIRFKCVCKKWESFILHDPYFRHIRRTMNHLFLILTPIITDPLSPAIKYDSNASYNVFLARVPIPESHGQLLNLNTTTHIFSMPNLLYQHFDVQCVNGLLCFYPKYMDSLGVKIASHPRLSTHIYNPITRQFITFPNVDHLDLSCYDSKPLQLFTHFGYDPLGDKFKVLRLFTNHNCRCELWILTVGDYVWRRVTSVMPSDIWPLVHVGICVNGAIHWCAFSRKALVTFDVESEQFGEIPIFDHQGCDTLIKMGDYLALIKMNSGEIDHIDVLILKDYQNHVWIQEKLIFSYRDVHVSGCSTFLCWFTSCTSPEFVLLLHHHYYDDDYPFRIYCYDENKGRIMFLMEVAKPTPAKRYLTSWRLLYYQENFMRL